MKKTINNEIALTYDDVQLVPRLSSIKSRLDVNISLDNPSLMLNVPIMSAAMDTITNSEMAIAISKAGGIGIIHRFQSVADRLIEIKKVVKDNSFVGVTIGLNETDEEIKSLCKDVDIISIDVAHGHNTDVMTLVSKVNDIVNSNYYHCYIMAGNVATPRGAVDLIRAGADIIKVGIGGGSICTTRIVTGFGIPNITAIMNIKNELIARQDLDAIIVADGGIKNSGDIAKAMAAGADIVMLGSMLAGTDETPGEIVLLGNPICMYKKYRGMASKDVQNEYGRLKTNRAAEGVSSYVAVKGPVKNIINNIVGGLKSALTYTGAYNLEQFYEKSEFIRVTQNGVNEANSHIFNKEGVKHE